MPVAIGGDWGSEAYGLTGGGGEGPGGTLDVRGDVTRGGRAAPLGGGGTDGALWGPPGEGPRGGGP